MKKRIVIGGCILAFAVTAITQSPVFALRDYVLRGADDPMDLRSDFEKDTERPGPLTEKTIRRNSGKDLIKNEIPQEDQPVKIIE